MFGHKSSFNSDLSTWDVSRVNNMYRMFYKASSFNSDLSNWDVSRVTTMAYMFSSASSFNGDISRWDVSRVTDMANMFYSASSFNGDISRWDVSKVTDMEEMFNGASSFAQMLCGDAWVTSTANKDRMFDGSSGRICTTTSKGKTTSLEILILTLIQFLDLTVDLSL